MKHINLLIIILLIGYISIRCDYQAGQSHINKTKIKEDSLMVIKDLEIAKKLIASGHYYSAEKIIDDANDKINSVNGMDSIKTILEMKLGTNKQEYQRKKDKKWEDLTLRNQDDTQIWYEQKYFTHYNNTNLLSIYYGIDRQPSISMLNSPFLKITYNGKDWIYFNKINLIYQDTMVKNIKFNEDDKHIDLDDPFESVHIPFSYHDRDFIKYLYNFSLSKNSKVQLMGEDTLTRNLSNEEKLGILDVLESYTIISELLN